MHSDSSCFSEGRLKTEQREIAREYPSTPLIGVGGLVVDGTRVLLVKRKNPPARGEWSIPGGLADLGETLKEAVAREVLEETGLVVNVGPLVELLERIFHDDSGRVKYHYVIADYYCRATGGALMSGSDALEAAWAERNDLAAFGLADITLQVVEKALDYQENT
jgi:8-oxo-dGTP diphosphatase